MPGPQRISSYQGPDAEPINLATDGLETLIPKLLAELGLDDPLGVGRGSSHPASVPPTGWKPLADLIGDVFEPARAATGVPRRIRLTSLTSGGDVISHALDKNYTRMDASADDVAKLIREGQLIPERPPGFPPEGASVPQLLSRLAKVLRRVPK